MSALGILAIIGVSMTCGSSTVKVFMKEAVKPDDPQSPELQAAFMIVLLHTRLVSGIGTWIAFICAIIALVQWFLGYYADPLPEL